MKRAIEDEIKTIIETEKSFLQIRQFPEKELLEKCVEEIMKDEDSLEKRPPIKIFGKEVHQPRNVGFFSNEAKHYKYSGREHDSKKLTENLARMLDLVNQLYDSDYNGILVNEYVNGDDNIGAHSDNESELIKGVGVVALSWGESRKFRIREKQTKEIIKDIFTENGELMQMGGQFQKEFTHEIPKEPNKKGKRISFTFRKHTNLIK